MTRQGVSLVHAWVIKVRVKTRLREVLDSIVLVKYMYFANLINIVKDQTLPSSPVSRSAAYRSPCFTMDYSPSLEVITGGSDL